MSPVLAGSRRAGPAAAATLTPPQSRAIDALLEHATQREAAAAAKVSERSLRRWVRDPDFQAELAARGKVVRQASVLVLQRGAVAASRALVEMATGDTAPNAARVTAARSVVELVLRVGDLEEVVDRLHELERLIAVAGLRGAE